MPHISDILKIERTRTDKASWNVIHLFKEGGFYRAYEWSAWLICVITYSDEVRKQTQDRRPLTVTHKRLKDGDDSYIFVGFPLNSMDKFIPQRTAFQPVGDAQIDVIIALPQPTDGTELTYDRLSEACANWKTTQPIQEPRKKDAASSVPGGFAAGKRMSITAIMADILAYPLEQHTLLDNTQYLSNVKQQLAALI